jgi:hypothetical protein
MSGLENAEVKFLSAAAGCRLRDHKRNSGNRDELRATDVNTVIRSIKVSG